MKKTLIILLVGILLGAAIQFFTRSTQTSYYVDICASVDGCCPGEGYTDHLAKYCPDNQESLGFPIRAQAADYSDSRLIVLLLVNTGIISLVVLIVAVPLMAFIRENLGKRNPGHSGRKT